MKVVSGLRVLFTLQGGGGEGGEGWKRGKE